MKKLFVSVLLVLALLAPATSTWASPLPPTEMALENLAKEAGPSFNITWTSDGQTPSFINAQLPANGTTPEEIAYNFFNRYGAIYKMQNPARELKVKTAETDELNITHVRMQQRLGDVPVFGAELIVHTTDQKIQSVNGLYFPGLSLETLTPELTQKAALELARQDLKDPDAEFRARTSSLVVYVNAGKPYLTWKINVFSKKSLGNWLYFIDAATGEVVHRSNQLDTAKSITVYNANNTQNVPGTLICGTGTANPTCSGQDAYIMGAYTNASKSYDYYYNVFGRDSYDGLGTGLVSTVHFATNYENAYWDGVQMVYGDGDTYAQAFDVVAHELTHGVTQETNNLIYEHQPGALNESWSDVMAVLGGCSTATGQTNCNWTLGETLTGGTIRSLSTPSAYDQPEIWSQYIWAPLAYDQGGVHINSGIPNKAAYLLIAGGTFNGVTVSGIGYTKTEQIYYRAMTRYLGVYSQFTDARDGLYQSCVDLIGTYNITLSNCSSVASSWSAVGLPRPTQTAPGSRRTYLPIASKALPTCATTQLLANGSFESQLNSWTVTSGNPSVTNSLGHGGTASSLVLGNANSITQTVYQNITIPAPAPYSQIKFYVAVGTEESTQSSVDRLTVQVLSQGGTIVTPRVTVIDNTYADNDYPNLWGWYTVTLTFNELLTRNVRLQLQATTNSTLRTSFLVDNISFSSTCTRYTNYNGLQIDVQPAPARKSLIAPEQHPFQFNR